MSPCTVFMFPGQGSQYPGMNKAIPADGGHFERLVKVAVELTGVALDQYICDGPDDVLARTENAQPALLTTGIAAARSLNDLGYHADVVMGHSLGEYAALVHAGVIDFEDGIRLVRTRGVLMSKACESVPGKMLAVVGMSSEDIAIAAQKAAQGEVLEITNHNAPSQFAVSGTCHAINRLAASLEGMNAVRAIPLNVSAPFHSSLMTPVADEFARHLAEVTFRKPQCLFIDNVTGHPEADPDKIRQKLICQLSQPVQWVQSIQSALGVGADRFIESGPGRVLGGLVKRTARGISILYAENIIPISDGASI